MMKKKMLCLVTMLVIASSLGCATQPLTPKQELRLSQRTFEEVVDTLVTLRKANKFNDAEWDKILVLMDSGERLLTQWTDAILKGEEPTVIDKFEAVLSELIEYQEKGGV